MVVGAEAWLGEVRTGPDVPMCLYIQPVGLRNLILQAVVLVRRDFWVR